MKSSHEKALVLCLNIDKKITYVGKLFGEFGLLKYNY